MKSRVILVALLSLTAVVGCESKFNHENFRMIQIGADDREDVRYILGEPDSDMGDIWMYDDPGERTAAIYFDDSGRVLNKEWMDAESGDWEGRDPWTDQPVEGETRERDTNTRRIND